MNRPVIKAEDFLADYESRFDYYANEAGEEVAWRFEQAVIATLASLSLHPELGRRRHFRHPRLAGLRSFRVEPPFSKTILFYRVTDTQLEAWRLMHGSRDLPRRLLEPPGLD
jgi:toxin ParE1/3/4